MVRRTAELGWRRFEAAQGRGQRLSVAQSLLCVVLQRLVARQIRAKLGGRLQCGVSGGAALALDIARWFIGMGLPVLQGYGLTEAAPVVSANSTMDNQPSSVGTALPGVQLRLGPGDEVLVKSAGVMRGYWNRPEDTRKIIDADGWLHTGDIGILNRDIFTSRGVSRRFWFYPPPRKYPRSIWKWPSPRRSAVSTGDGGRRRQALSLCAARGQPTCMG